jgi:hypothetical protein
VRLEHLLSGGALFEGECLPLHVCKLCFMIKKEEEERREGVSLPEIPAAPPPNPGD